MLIYRPRSLTEYISPLLPVRYSSPSKATIDHLGHILDLCALQRGPEENNLCDRIWTCVGGSIVGGFTR
jgi:hypothetical protein